jgi:hypothetical protein
VTEEVVIVTVSRSLMGSGAVVRHDTVAVLQVPYGELALSTTAMSTAACLLVSSFSRQLRAASLPRITARLPQPLASAACQRRSIFGFGKSNPGEPSVGDVEARAKAITEALMQKEEWRKLATHTGAIQSMQTLLTILSKKGTRLTAAPPWL